MKPALEHTRDLHELLIERLVDYSMRAGALAAEAGETEAGDNFWTMSTDLAALVPIVEELQDRERFPRSSRQHGEVPKFL